MNNLFRGKIIIQARQYAIYFLTVIGLHGLSSCYNGSSRSNQAELYNKKYAGAIAQYHDAKDSLKLKALRFILANLDDQFYFRSNWLDAYKNSIQSINKPSTTQLAGKLDSIKRIYPATINKVSDTSVLTNTFLIRNIDEAFRSVNFKWSKDVSFTDFCEYVLPYKIGNEKPDYWRQLVWEQSYLNLDSLARCDDAFSATAYVNNHLNWMKGTLNYDYPTDIGYRELKSIATGSCYSISRVALFEMRSLGLPVAIDYTPSWGNRSEGHYWAALIQNGKPYPLDAAGPNIGFYKIEYKGMDRIPYKISKVFRQTFSIQKNSLQQLRHPADACPPVFESSRIKDVTDQYIPVSDIKLRYHSAFKERFAYLFTFNDKTWTPCYWGVIDDHVVTFKNMGRDILYLPALYLNSNEIIPLGDPFIVYKDGTVKQLKVNTKKRQPLKITRKYPEDETNKIKKGDLYETLFWDNGWKSLGAKVATANELTYNNAPMNALFLVKDLTEGKQERIFTYENESQVWW